MSSYGNMLSLSSFQDTSLQQHCPNVRHPAVTNEKWRGIKTAVTTMCMLFYCLLHVLALWTAIFRQRNKHTDHLNKKYRCPITDLKAQRGWMVTTTPWPIYPREKPGTYGTGGWVAPRVGLDMCEKSCPYRDSIPWPSSP
jgi:hypothetical protein